MVALRSPFRYILCAKEASDEETFSSSSVRNNSVPIGRGTCQIRKGRSIQGSVMRTAFVLEQSDYSAAIAERNQIFATAYHKYQASLDILHTIRSDSPDWNAQMVEYRLKDCQSRFDAVKAKLPSPPPAAPSRCVGDHTHGSSANPATSTRGYSSYSSASPCPGREGCPGSIR